MGKTIVITGAGRGLGRALARRFAADGDQVIALGRTLPDLRDVAEEIGAGHLAIQCDVASPESVRAAFAAITAACPRVDVLINNAAVFEPFTLADAGDEQIKDHLSINLAGPILCARSALSLLRGGGHIINVTSQSTTLKLPMLWMYGATKVGLEFVSEVWAQELEADGVRVTVVRAGMMTDANGRGSPWPEAVSAAFVRANAQAGIDLRSRPLSRYASVTDAFRAVIDMPPDLHVGLVALTASQN